MALPALRVETTPETNQPAHLTPLLNRLRVLALTCRAQAALDVHKACAMLSDRHERAGDAYASALLRALNSGGDTRMRLYRPGCGETSFDEAWLMRLIDRVRSGDADSTMFLLGRRIPAHQRRAIIFLVAGLAKTCDSL